MLLSYRSYKRGDREWSTFDKKSHPLKILYPFSFTIYKKMKKVFQKKDERLFTQLRELEVLTTREVEESVVVFRCKQISFFLFVVILGLSFSFLLSIKEEKDESNNIIIERNDTGDGSKEVNLSIKNEDEENRYSLEIQEIPYTKQQWEEKVEEAISYIDEVIQGDNISLDEVRTNLVFPDHIPDSGIEITYETSQREWIDEFGNVDVSEIKDEGELVEIEVTFCYKDFEKVRIYTVHLVPEIKSEEQKNYEMVTSKLKQEEESSLYEKELKLPKKIGDYTIEYAGKLDDYEGILICFSIGIGGLLFFREEENMKEKLKHRTSQLLKDYPDFLHQLVLFMGAGMTLKASFIRIAENYIKKKEKHGKSRYLYEEIVAMTYEFQAGISEVEVYRNLSHRIGLLPYKRMMELLIQNLKKGSGNLIEMLIQEEHASLEMRKEQAKRLGEEAGTKLLMPMILLLGVVLLLVLYPAMEQFQLY